MGYLMEERETHIYLDPVEKVWKACTNMPNWKDRFLKAGWVLKAVTKVDGEECDWEFITDKVTAVRLKDLTKPVPDRSKQIEALRKYRESVIADVETIE